MIKFWSGDTGYYFPKSLNILAFSPIPTNFPNWCILFWISQFPKFNFDLQNKWDLDVADLHNSNVINTTISENFYTKGLYSNSIVNSHMYVSMLPGVSGVFGT